MIIGISPGRSGSYSFAKEFGIWHELKTLHGKFYSEDPVTWMARLERMSEEYGRTVGDVSFDHIKSIDHWIHSGATVVALIREREGFVESMYKRGLHRPLLRLFPEHDFDSKDGLRRFWDWFYEEVFKRESQIVITSAAQYKTRMNTTEGMIKEMRRLGMGGDRYDETAREAEDQGMIIEYLED